MELPICTEQILRLTCRVECFGSYFTRFWGSSFSMQDPPFSSVTKHDNRIHSAWRAI